MEKRDITLIRKRPTHADSHKRTKRVDLGEAQADEFLAYVLVFDRDKLSDR